MEVKEQLARLVRIQELVVEVQRSRALVEDAPAKVEGIEARFRERNAEYVALKRYPFRIIIMKIDFGFFRIE